MRLIKLVVKSSPIRRIIRGIWAGPRRRRKSAKRWRLNCPDVSNIFAEEARGLVAGLPEALAAGALGEAEPVDFVDEDRAHGCAAEVGGFAAVVEAAGVDGEGGEADHDPEHGAEGDGDGGEPHANLYAWCKFHGGGHDAEDSGGCADEESVLVQQAIAEIPLQEKQSAAAEAADQVEEEEAGFAEAPLDQW